jgi:hypothetical protein
MRRRVTWIALLVAASACSPGDEPEPSPAGVRRFAKAGEDIVRDSRTGLLWTARDAGRELAWGAARRHCREIALAAGGAWRLPSIEELAALYEESQHQPCDDGTCRVDPAIDLASPYQWSGTARGENRRVYFDFQHGSELAPLLRPALTRRALCVGEQASRPR